MRAFKVGSALATTLLAAGSALTLAAAPAVAGGHLVGSTGAETRCANGRYGLCLYYDSYESGAYWATNSSVKDLTGKLFRSGTGDGSGKKVINDAASADCANSTLAACNIWYNQNYSGDYDELYGYQIGNLYFTYNDEASVQLES